MTHAERLAAIHAEAQRLNADVYLNRLGQQIIDRILTLSSPKPPAQS